MNLNDARQRIPELAGLNDASAIDVIHQVYYPGMDKMELSRRLGYEPPPAPTESAGVLRTLGDLGIKGAQGVVDLGASAVGMGNMLSGGLVGQGMDAIGYDPKGTHAAMGEYLSSAQKAADQRVQDAQGFWGTLARAATEPRFIAGSVAQSLAGMLGIGAMQSAAAGAIAARAALATAEGAAAAAGKTGASAMQAALATPAGQRAAQSAVDAAGTKLMAIGAASEGAQSMGSIAQDAQQSGRTWSQYAHGALAAGVGTGAIALGAGKLMGDAGTEMFTGARTQLGSSLPMRMAKSGLSEGVLEEMPQSAQERYFGNLAMGQTDPMKGVGEDAATGLLSGAAMGVGMGGMHGHPAHAPISVTTVPAPPTTATQPEGPMARAVRAGQRVASVAAMVRATAQQAELARQADEQARFDALVAENQAAVQPTPAPAPDPISVEMAAYAKRMADRPALEDSDILNAMGRPFTNLRAASKAAQAAGSDYAPFKLDDQAFVVRKQQVPSQSPSQPPSQNPSEGAAPIPATNPGDANGNQTQTPSQAAQEVLTPASGTPQVLPAEPDNIPGDAHAQTAQAVQTETPPATQAAALMPAPDPVLSRAKPIDSGPAVVLQNRDRSSAASIAQMHEIAAKPDYLRAGQSSVMDSGAPVVFGDLPPSAVRGKAQEIADGKGQRTPIQYAVVDAPDLIASHLADGTSVQAYAQGSPGKLRAVAGNGRAAGIIEGYARGTAQQYRDDLAKDAQALGLDPGALAALHAPVLVRVMDSKDVTPDMGDRSNITGTARLSSVEQASTDARRLNLQSLEFHEDGNPTQVAVTEFVRAMPTSEQAELMAPDGTPTKQAVDRLMAATFKQAYGSDALVGLYAQAQDPQARTILSGLADAAAGMASLKDSGEFDIRAAVTEAAGYAVNARRLGQRLSDMLKTADMMMSDEALVVAQFMAENVRSAKKISQGLRNVAQYAAQQAHIEHDNTTQEGMFGATPTASRSDILRKLHANQPLVAATATPFSVTPSTAPQDHLQRPPGTPEAQGVAQPTQAARPEAEPVAASEPVEPAPAVARAEPEVEPLTLASYTNADALQRERHLADTARLDQREQIQREASDQTLTSETPVDARQDSTGEMFAREKTQAQAQAAREELNTRNAGKPTAVDPNQGSMFDAPAVPAHENTLNPHETDTGVAMFSQGEVSHPSTVPAVESAIHELTGTFLGSQLGRIVATTASDIKSTWEPLIGKDLHLEFDRGAGHAQGFFDPTSKTIFLIADQIEAGTEQAVLAHELMHKHGQAVLGERGWNHLHSVIDGWKGAPEGSSERAVYDYASARVNAAGVDLSSQELFPYAVEAALKLGIKPNAFAKQGTAAKWLAQVKLALKTVWDKLTGKPDKFKAQDLVNLAFGIAQKENHAVETFNDGKSRVRSSTGKFRGWPKYNSWTRAEYQDVVSLLPEVYRSDPHRREPFSTRDWDLLADSALPEIKDLNDRVGPGTFGLDGLGNIVADARNNDASIFADEAIAIADKHDLGIYLTGVHPRSFVRLRDAGFVPELGLSLILLRESGSNQMPFAQADNVYANPAYGIVMSRKPRGFAAPMFSRAAGKALIERATDNLGQTFSHPGKLSWWDKTVGSPYHLAQRYPAFKPVFTSAQNFINDVSFYATEAADMAAKMLPKLENWSDLLKTPISAADNKAISVPILEGTLNWSRDDAGKPLRIAQDDEETTPGIVWSDAELHSLFHLTPPRIALYREFRSSVDKSLDNLGKADLLRIGGKDTAELKDAVMAAKDVIQAAILLHRHLHAQQYLMPERTEVLIDAARGMVARANKIERLKQLGYAPLSRFGRYWVDVVVDGRRQYFGLFETGRAANQMAKRLKAEFGPQNVAQGTLSEREFEMFQGITPESLELFGNMLGLDSQGDQAQDKVFQTYLKRTKANRSALKRLIHRKGTSGYSDDMGRVLAAFVYSNARQTSAALHMGELGAAVNAIPKAQGQLKDAAIELASYIKQPREEAQALRGLLFTQYLGGSVASAFVNITQPFAVSIPYLSQYGGAAKATKLLIGAMKDMSIDKELEPTLAKALKVAQELGVVAPQEVHQLLAQARGASTLRIGDGSRLGEAMTGVRNSFSKLMLGWGKMFGMAEQINRRSTFIAAYRLAQDRKIVNPASFATQAVNETQFINNKANKANWARGPVGSTLMTFKSYSVNYLELLHRMATQGGPQGRQAALLMLATLMLMAGSSGMPFVDDAEDLIDFLGQRLGYNFSSKKARQEFLEGLLGRAGAQFVDKGLTGLPGSPIDVSGRLSMANLIPGTGLLLKKTDHTRDVAELAGAAGDMAARAFQAGDQALSGDLGKAVVTLAPKAVGNLAKGVDMAGTGMYRDDKGYKVIETTPTEAAMKMLGFQPANVAEVQQANYLHQRSKDFYDQHAQDIRARWAKGIFENSPEQVDAARTMLHNWNVQNPDQRIGVNMQAVVRRVKEMRKSKDQRIADTAPKAMRASMRREMQAMREGGR